MISLWSCPGRWHSEKGGLFLQEDTMPWSTGQVCGQRLQLRLQWA